MEVINLNLIPTGALPVVHASQYDEGRTFRANLMDGSVVYTLDGTEVLECDVKKPDGNIVTVAVTNTSDSYVEIDTTLQMCACAGESLAELHITKGAQEIGTLNFILAVERSPLEGGIQSASEIHNLATQVAGLVATEVENQYDSANVIFDNDPTTGHGVGYAVTSEGVKNAIDAIAPAASSVSYDNTGSGMTATNVQDAIDELDTEVGDLSALTTTVKSSLVGAVNEVNASLSASVTPISVTVNSVINSNITKRGKVVHIEYSFSLKAMTGTIQNKTWGTIPEGFRPTSEVIFNAYYISDYASNVETKAILISASSSGYITTPNNGANGTLSNPTTNSRIYMSATYIVS